MDNLVIVGSGGFAREVRWLIEECNAVRKSKWNILGWISNEEKGCMISGLPVLGTDEWIINYSEPLNVVIAVGNGKLRERLAINYKTNPFLEFPNIISPQATVSDSVTFGCGCIIATNSIFTVDISVGNFMICNLACTVGHDCRIGNYVTLYPGAHVSGNVTLGNTTSLGTGANIIQGINVGDDAYVGAGATVIRNVPDGCTVVGVPAKPVEHKNE